MSFETCRSSGAARCSSVTASVTEVTQAVVTWLVTAHTLQAANLTVLAEPYQVLQTDSQSLSPRWL